MTSSLLDAVVCVLLVSAAVVTVTNARREAAVERRGVENPMSVSNTDSPAPVSNTDSPAPVSNTDRSVSNVGGSTTLSLLFTVTTTVDSQRGIPRSQRGISRSQRGTPRSQRGTPRRLHGTVASLLTTAALHSARIRGTRLVPDSTELIQSVRTVTEHLIPERTRVVARWQPYRGSELAGRVVVGSAPPSGAPVHTAGAVVPVRRAGAWSSTDTTELPRVSTRRDRSGRPESITYSDLAAAVADDITRLLFPPQRLAWQLRTTRDAATAVRERYRRLWRALGSDRGTSSSVVTDQSSGESAGHQPWESLDTGRPATARVRAANDRLGQRLRGVVERRLRSQSVTAVGARRLVGVGHVRITVRWWSA